MELPDSASLDSLANPGISEEEWEESFLANSPVYPQQRNLHQPLGRGVQGRLDRVDPTPSLGPPLARLINQLLQRDLLTLLAPNKGLDSSLRDPVLA